MPLYDYTCKKCSKEVEILKPMSKSDDKEECPDCKEVMDKKLTSSAFIINGYSYNNAYGS